MFQRRFAILFFWLTGHNEESSYLNLTKGDTKEKVIKEKSTCFIGLINLHRVAEIPAFGRFKF